MDQNNFEISNFSSLGTCQPSVHPVSVSHNSLFLNFCTMEDDCEDSQNKSCDSTRSRTTQDMLDMTQLFASITTQIKSATQKISSDFKQVVEANDDFKKSVREELDESRLILSDQKWLLNIMSSSTSTAVNVSTTSVPPSSGNINYVPQVSPSQVHPAPSPVSSMPDVQSQMMLMLTDSFTKLSSALMEKSDTKSDWPKFSGDSKKFRSWYLAIMAQLSLPPWLEFYDTSKNDIILTTSNSMLNGKLYSKLLLALEGSTLQSIVSKKHLRENGLLLLQNLVQTYKPKNVLEIIAVTTGEFWSNTKRYPNESIDTYFNHFHELLDNLSDADEPIPLKSAICHSFLP
jgi:hypothetical protein